MMFNFGVVMDLQEVHDRLFQFYRRNALVFGETSFQESILRALISHCERGPILPIPAADFTEELSLARGFFPVLYVEFDYTFRKDVHARAALNLFHDEEQKTPREFCHTFSVFYLDKPFLDRIREKLLHRMMDRDPVVCYEDSLGLQIVFPFRKGERLRHLHYALDPIGSIGSA